MEIKSSLLNHKLMQATKKTLIEVSKDDHKEDFRVKTIEYIDRTEGANRDMFFWDMVPFIRFVPNDGETTALTREDGRIYFNAPGIIGEDRKTWEFIHCHECLHQLWDTFKVKQKIIDEGIEYDHYLLNVASDCVINDWLEFYRKKPRPKFGIIFPDYLEEKYEVIYDRKKDTQYTLYLKLLEKKNELHKDQQLQDWVKDDTKFNDKIKVPVKHGNGSNNTPPPAQPLGTHSEDFKKGWRDAIQDVLDKKIDPQTYTHKSGDDDYTKGYNECVDTIKKGLKNGITISKDKQKNTSQGNSNKSDLADIPWDLPSQGSQGSDDSSDNSQEQKDASDAQNSADKAKDAADKAQQAADQARKDGDPSANKKQQAADRAKQAADEAQKQADKAKEAAKDGNTGDEQDAADRADNAANEAQAAADEAQGNSSKNQMSGEEAASNAQDSADKAKEAAARAKKAADEASKQYGESSKEAKDAQKEAKKANESSKNAQKAADAAKKASKDGDTEKANREAQKAKEEADIANTQANRAENIKDGRQPQGKKNRTNRTKGEHTVAFSDHGKGQSEDPEEYDYWDDENIEEIKAHRDKLIDQYSRKLSGDMGSFLKQCKNSQALKPNGLEVTISGKGHAGWNTQMMSTIRAYIKNRVFKQKRRKQSTYTRIKRGSGFVKYGQPISPGVKDREDQLDIKIVFYLDKSGSMSGCIDQVFDAAYAISDVLNKQFKNEQIIKDIEYKMFAFDEDMHELKWGKKCHADRCNMEFWEMLQFMEGHTKDYMITVIITDAGYPINDSKVNKFLKEIDGIILFICNCPNDDIKKVAENSEGKLRYIETDSSFTIDT